MPTRICLTVFASLLVVAPPLLGLGADYPKGPLGNSAWPKGFAEVVNRPERVHGFFVNSVDMFFYAGDTQALNQFLEAYGKVADASLKVIIHPGAKNAWSPWDKKERDLPIQWSLRSEFGGDAKHGRMATHVDVWLGSRIRLEELRIPAHVDAVSGGEIERFLAERRQKSDKQ